MFLYSRSNNQTGRFYGTQNANESVGWVVALDHPTSPFLDHEQHPSYELLKENGFEQMKYSKYRAKALRGNKKPQRLIC